MSEDTTTRQIVVFSLAAEEYAIPISQVQEIIRYKQPRSTGAANDPALRGVISLRGRILPIYDLALYLGLVSADDPTDGNIVIAEIDGVGAGLIVGQVIEVRTFDEDQLDRNHINGNPAIEGIIKIDDRLIVMLDCSPLIGVCGGSDNVDSSAAPAGTVARAA